MGGSQSKEQQQNNQNKVIIQTDPLIKKLRNNLQLKLDTSSKDFHNTNSFAHRDFSNQLKKYSKGKITQKFSPFCSVFVYDKEKEVKKIFNCILISPILALVPSSYKLFDEKELVYENLEIIGFGKDLIKSNVKKISKFSKANVGVVILQTPIWELGWCGFGYFMSASRLSQTLAYAIDNNFQRNDKKQIQIQDRSPINSKIQKIFFNINQFQGKASNQGQQLIFTIKQAKVVVIGIQQGQKCQFFTPQIYQQLKSLNQTYLKPSVQRQVLKQIDIIALQMQSQW